MLKAALSVAGRVVVADSHIACFEKLSSEEQDAIDLDSGFYDSETQEFISETERIGFYDKEIYRSSEPKAL